MRFGKYNKGECYKCNRLGHFRNDCDKIHEDLKKMLEIKATAEQQQGHVNTIKTTNDKENAKSMTEEENSGLNIQTRTERNNIRDQREDQRRALAYLSKETQPRRSGSNRS